MAGRKRKISTAELKDIVIDYCTNNPFTILKKVQLANYAKTKGYCNIIDKDFSRDIEISSYILEYNTALTTAVEAEDQLAILYSTTDPEEFLRKNPSRAEQIKAIQYLDRISKRKAEISALQEAKIEELETEIQQLTKKINELELTLNVHEETVKENKALNEKNNFLVFWIERNFSQIVAQEILSKRHESIKPIINSEIIPDEDSSVYSLSTSPSHNGVKKTKKTFELPEIQKVLSFDEIMNNLENL
ncbi:MAG: hypothetical protein IKU20_02075 [Lachnospiraceae bacterium]|nr:hypothetical protein [Lachnospiraceae bacterium]